MNTPTYTHDRNRHPADVGVGRGGRLEPVPFRGSIDEARAFVERAYREDAGGAPAVSPLPLVVVTGHRPKGLGVAEPYSRRTEEALREVALRALDGSVELYGGVRGVITGMALGWDQAVARACVDLGVPFVAAVPFRGQEARWSADAQASYRRLLDRAARVVVVSKGRYSPGAMERRNRWMLDRALGACDGGGAAHVMALYDGDSPGGTRNALEYVFGEGEARGHVERPDPSDPSVGPVSRWSVVGPRLAVQNCWTTWCHVRNARGLNPPLRHGRSRRAPSRSYRA